MKKYISVVALAMVLLFSVTGCKSTKIYDVPKQNVVEKVSQKDVYKSIIRAATQRGWDVKKVKDGVIDATYAKREFSVTVTVTYSANSYDINYKESEGLKYDSEAQTIHKNYNSWVRNLRQSIDRELTLIKL